MGSTHNLNLKSGIKLNGHDILDLDPHEVAKVISSDKTGILKAILKDKMYDTEFPLPDDYAKHAGRPSLTERPWMTCENDGYPYLPGHSPMCDGKPYAKAGGRKMVCKCKYDDWNHEGGHTKEVWPGMDIDDFDM